MSTVIFTNNPEEAKINNFETWHKIDPKWAEGYEFINKAIKPALLMEYLIQKGYNPKAFSGLASPAVANCGYIFIEYVNKYNNQPTVAIKRVTYHPKTLAGLERMDRRYNPVYEDNY